MHELANHLNDALLGVPPEFRREQHDFVVERAVASSLAATRQSLDALITDGRAHLGVDDALATRQSFHKLRAGGPITVPSFVSPATRSLANKGWRDSNRVDHICHKVTLPDAAEAEAPARE